MAILYACDTRAYTSAARFVDSESGRVQQARSPVLDILYTRPFGQVRNLKPSVQREIDSILAA
jgi:hypothetical protein